MRGYRGHRLSPRPLRVSLSVLMLSGALAGLVWMHVIGLHGTGAAAAVPIVTTSESHHLTDAGAAGAHLDAAAPLSHHQCADCAGATVGLLCAVVLLSVALFLVAPQRSLLRRGPPRPGSPRSAPMGRRALHPPSLQVLCISRT